MLTQNRSLESFQRKIDVSLFSVPVNRRGFVEQPSVAGAVWAMWAAVCGLNVSGL